jgi:hypothetical protein
MLLCRVAPDGASADERARLHGGNGGDDAVALDLDAVVPARKALAEVPSEREARTAVRAAILERMHGAVLATPEDQVLAQPRDAERSLVQPPGRQDRVPKVAQSRVEQSVEVHAVWYFARGR